MLPGRVRRASGRGRWVGWRGWRRGKASSVRPRCPPFPPWQRWRSSPPSRRRSACSGWSRCRPWTDPPAVKHLSVNLGVTGASILHHQIFYSFSTSAAFRPFLSGSDCSARMWDTFGFIIYSFAFIGQRRDRQETERGVWHETKVASGLWPCGSEGAPYVGYFSPPSNNHSSGLSVIRLLLLQFKSSSWILKFLLLHFISSEWNLTFVWKWREMLLLIWQMLTC